MNEKTIEEILNFDIQEELNLENFSEEKKDEILGKLFGQMSERIIKETGKNLSEEDKGELIRKIENQEDIKEIFEFIAERNENFYEEAGKTYFDFKKEMVDFLK